MQPPAGASPTRRDVLRNALAASAALGAAEWIRPAPAGAQPAKKTIRAGLIGCGGRGNGAASDCIEAGKHLYTVDVKIVALADAYPDRLEGVRGGLAKQGQDVPKDHCFVGFDAYKKLCASDLDLVLMATTPVFRPVHYAAAVAAGRHVFIEKPVAVDPVGCRAMYETGKLAEQKKLTVVAGTCLRHAPGYAATRQVVVVDKAIGTIRGGAFWYNTNRLWHRPRQAGWNDAEYLVRNWVNFNCMSGDHIVEQYIHTLDMTNWHMGANPVAVVGVGGRARRQTGDQYDFFSVDYEYANNVHVHGMCRQINGCWGRANQGELWGDKGFVSFPGTVTDVAKAKLPLPKLEWHNSMYVQEHCVLLDSILNGKAVNHTKDVTDSTLAAIMSRIAAYTGQRVTWEEMMKSELSLKPSAADFEAGEVKAPAEDVIPLPGKA
jgi:myo-inositol 2-dehydrogenase/D-chiro-inositol 1-dehydrogenase